MPVETRLTDLERRVTRLEDTEPRVLAERIEHMSAEIHELREDFRGLRSALVSFLLTFAFSAITIVVSLFVVFR